MTGEERVAALFRGLLADLANWVRTEGWHGYEPEAEAHHGTEPFLLFLPRYLGLFPEDEVARQLLEDAAHHIGNWVEGIPPWFDHARDCFSNYHLVTRVVGLDARYAYETAEHFRFIHIALAAYRVLGEDGYLEWSLRYGRRRAQRILDAGEGAMPVLWDLDGHGLREADLTTPEQRSMAGSEATVAFSWRKADAGGRMAGSLLFLRRRRPGGFLYATRSYSFILNHPLSPGGHRDAALD